MENQYTITFKGATLHIIGEIDFNENGRIWNGDTMYFKNGKRHQEDGPAVIMPNGNMMYYKHGVVHRKDGPAVILFDDSKRYYKHGKLHRKDGPATIMANYRGGIITSYKTEYWENGVMISK